jgi:pimeloyl-ACP methyl ester carboxylesterase
VQELSIDMKPAPSFFADDALKRAYLSAYDGVLEKWPVPYERLMISTELGVTHVLASGALEAPPLVLLHAAMATATVWRPNVFALSQHFRVYAVDVIGQGGYSVATRKISKRQEYVGWMNQLFDAVGIDKVSIVGNSYGGFLAFNQASLSPDRVERIIAMSPPGVFVSLLPLTRRFLLGMLRSTMLRLLRVTPKRRTIADFLAPGATFHARDADWLAFSEQFVNGGVRMNAAFPRVFPDRELRGIAAPALLLIAEHETMYEPERALRIAKARMPRLRGAIVPGAHHLAAMADPDFVNGAIVRFLKSPNAM